jgi:DNA-binding MarR family transcriptional regulator
MTGPFCCRDLVGRLPVIFRYGRSMVDTPEVATELTMAMTRLRARLRLESSAPVRNWTWSQLSTLRRIIEHGPATAAALAQIEHVRPQSIAETIAALKADDLVTTGPDPADRRKSLISATARGHQVADSIIEQREHWLTMALETVTNPAEQRLLADATALLNRLADCRLPTETANPAETAGTAAPVESALPGAIAEPAPVESALPGAIAEPAGTAEPAAPGVPALIAKPGVIAGPAGAAALAGNAESGNAESGVIADRDGTAGPPFAAADRIPR